MTVKDLDSNSIQEFEERAKIEQLLKELDMLRPGRCFQCTKCTSGCEAMKLLELQPHKMTALAKAGYIHELLNSEVIWTCVTCYKCKERCPQKVSPVDIMFIAKNIAILTGKQVPGEYSNWLQNVLGTGFIFAPQQVRTKDGETVGRAELGLPEISKPEDMAKFGTVMMSIAMAILEVKH